LEEEATALADSKFKRAVGYLDRAAIEFAGEYRVLGVSPKDLLIPTAQYKAYFVRFFVRQDWECSSTISRCSDVLLGGESGFQSKSKRTTSRVIRMGSLGVRDDLSGQDRHLWLG